MVYFRPTPLPPNPPQGATAEVARAGAGAGQQPSAADRRRAAPAAAPVRAVAAGPAVAVAAAVAHGSRGSGAGPGSLPPGLFAPGSSLPTKVETLRMHLEECLGGEQAFKRVYAYVLRDENGECEGAAERTALLDFLGAERKRLLPLVYTLAYMEDALAACGMVL